MKRPIPESLHFFIKPTVSSMLTVSIWSLLVKLSVAFVIAARWITTSMFFKSDESTSLIFFSLKSIFLSSVNNEFHLEEERLSITLMLSVCGILERKKDPI